MNHNFDQYLKDYERDGFVAIKNIIPQRKLDYMQETVEQYIEQALKLEGLEVPNDLAHDGYMRLDELRKAKKGKRDRIHTLYNMLRRSDAMNTILADEDVMSAIRKIIHLKEQQTAYCWTQFLRMDAPKDSSYSLSWHQESFSTIENVPQTQLWAPVIGPNTKENGSISVLKGTHHDGPVPHYLIQYSENYIADGIPDDKIQNRDKYEEVIVEMDPGSILLFHEETLHKSGINTSDKVRYTITGRYFNPYHKDFYIPDDEELMKKARLKCVNADEFREYIDENHATVN